MVEETEKKEKNTLEEKKPEKASAVPKNSAGAKPENTKKVRGARRSKVDPAILTVMQHEASKVRIFKRMMILFGICVVLAVAYSIYAHIQKKNEDKAYVESQLGKLAALEATFSKEDQKKIYTSAVNAVTAFRLAEDVLLFAIQNADDELKADMQARLEKYRKVMQESSPVNQQSFVSSTIMMDMVFIPRGSFMMGAGEELGDHTIHENRNAETPRRQVVIGRSFWIARYEITNRQFRKLIPAHVVKEWNHYDFNQQDLAATRISWEEAVYFCMTLTEKERALGRIPEGYEYRLPTEAEWEYVCRAGTDTVYFWGNDFGAEGAKYANSLDLRTGNKFKWEGTGEQWGCAPTDPFDVVAPTGSFLPNPWGIYDMSGNVSEWCYDYYAPNAYRLFQVQRKNVDPCNLTAATVPYRQKKEFDSREIVRAIPCRVHRGGNWGCSPERLRSSARLFMPQNEKDTGVGFRPVLAPIIKSDVEMRNVVK